ncbi:MAG TPA: hypothetical protein VGN06_03000 [Gaiellaceae bacterium]|jgi:hypothetical protein
MQKSAAAVAAAVAVLALGLLSGVALAGDHGNHGSQSNQPGSAQNGNASDQAGVKPGNDTSKDQTCTTGGGQGSSATCSSATYARKSDSSKRYGNGRTAAQIANDKGAPAGTPIYGPGNSQPHKICGRDVHAYKGGDCEKQTPPKSLKPQLRAQVAITPAATTTTESTTTTTVATTMTTTVAAVEESQITPPPPAATSGVLGALKALSAPAAKPAGARAGVLGSLKTLGSTATSGTLPFTGLRLWIVELIALGLIGSGMALRLVARRRLN